MRFLSHMIAQAGGRRGMSAPHSSDLTSVVAVALLIMMTVAGSDASILKLVHRYSNRKGSSKEGGRKGGMSEEHWQVLLRHDKLRHRHSPINAVNFPLEGSYDPTVAGLYYTKIDLGTPLKSYLVQVDTGSDVMWVNCKPCTGCPQKNAFGGPMNIYDPKKSSTMSMVGCSDKLCAIGEQAQEAFCTLNKTCGYSFQYGDGTITQGQYLRDELKYTQLDGNNSRENTTMNIIFGCSFSQSGSLANEETIVDGLIGFGQLDLSIPSQLAAQGKTPRKFAHCLEGEAGGGGILVVGEVAASGLKYTPIVPNLNHYNVNLRSLAVNGVILSIDASLFTSGPDSGVIFDSGTTFTYLPQRVYDVFVKAIIEASTAQHILSQQDICFVVTNSLDASFPYVSLNFKVASMQLKPRHYLLQKSNIQYSFVVHGLDAF
ncbi:hypothetical protein O6H91_12G048400 [Diphasiastrum complanatum]|uniref:Uncharacterized protein n=2 Tax=Diphasiastrum complanatum TaxID=34168 RepID=A0ACC2C1F1_DIPCM|nr:hypothetical protein O6H91_12G048400 [Diphasiastrum complanatum]KAJ7535848.1 hypothetical protein O6H91_12G048400 [Diphasiastrum complanatum]